MYLLYLDESGDPTSWEIQNHFVIGGVAIHEGQVYQLTRQLDAIQAGFFPGITVPIPFHAADIRTGHGRFRGIDLDSRLRLLDDVYQVISTARFPNLIVFATSMHISAAQNAGQVLRDTFEDVCERFNKMLVRQFNLGHPDKGLLIIDRAHEQRYRELLAQFHSAGTTHGYLGNIVDIPYFAGRRDTRMIQLADFCAHAVFRYYENRDTTYFNQVLPRFDRRIPRHPPDGLKHITQDPCSCEACSWR